MFQGCEHIRWDIHSLEQISDLEADLIGFELGAATCQKPAVIYTDIFELEILYDQFELRKLSDSKMELTQRIEA